MAKFYNKDYHHYTVLNKQYSEHCMIVLLTETNEFGESYITSDNMRKIKKVLNEKFPNVNDFKSEWKYIEEKK